MRSNSASLRCTYLKEKSCSFNVILLGGNMKCWQANFSSCITFQENSYNFVMTLLHCHSQWCKAIFSGQALIGTICQQ
uniref:Uncharacterized protein n=1 Tax=Phlebotomus papatasi TaxID=29031 RepID=A0A1B0D0G5_PHLPP